jgi:hypothetical protein
LHKLGGKRSQEERRGCSCGVALWRRMYRGELLMWYSDFQRGISQRANCLVFASAVFEIRRASQETVFLLQRYSIHAEHHVGVLLCGKSSS